MTPSEKPQPSGPHVVPAGNRARYNSFEAGTHEPGRLKAVKIIEVLKSLKDRGSVADIGCHDGTYSAMFGGVEGVRIMHGFDIADKALAAAEKRGLNVFLWNMGFEPCPSRDHFYDVLIASEVIEHLVDTEFFIRELKRILKPGGHLILTTPNLHYWLNRVKIMLGKIPWNYPGVSPEFKTDPNVNTEHIRVNGISEWKSFFTARGFDVLKIEGISWAVPDSFKGKIISAIDSWMPCSAQCLTLYLLRNGPGEKIQ